MYNNYLLLMNPSNQFTGVGFNANGIVTITDSNSSALAGFSRAAVINFALTTAGWKIFQ